MSTRARFAGNCLEFLQSDEEFPAVGCLNAAKDPGEIWDEAQQLGVRVYEVAGVNNRRPVTYFVVHPDDLGKLPTHEEHPCPVLAYPLYRIHREDLRADHMVLRSFEPAAAPTKSLPRPR